MRGFNIWVNHLISKVMTFVYGIAAVFLAQWDGKL